jgi:hypothetical protein
MHPRSLLRQLTRIPHEKPCDTLWESMLGTDKVRHCPSCERQVYSLSDMTELEAELRLLNAGEAVPCIRYARNADGEVAHLVAQAARPRGYLSSASARALVVASALGTGLTAQAQEKDKEPTQCVMLSGLENASPPAAAPAAGAGAPAPSPRPSASAPAAAPPSPPPPPIPLAGAPPPPRQQIAYGTLTVRSKTPRDLDVHGIKLKAPLDVFRMTPGEFVLKVEGKKPRTIKFTIKLNEPTTIDLDKK